MLGAYFGHSPEDWGADGPTEWFHGNQKAMLFDLDQLPRIPHKMNTGPESEGIYFLFLDDELVYVGQACRIMERLNRHAYPTLSRHHADWFSHYAAVWVPRLFLDSVEAFYIHYFNPPRNIALPALREPASTYLELVSNV